MYTVYGSGTNLNAELESYGLLHGLALSIAFLHHQSKVGTEDLFRSQLLLWYVGRYIKEELDNIGDYIGSCRHLLLERNRPQLLLHVFD